MGSAHAIMSRGVSRELGTLKTYLRNSRLEIYAVIAPKADGCFKKSGPKGRLGNEEQNEKSGARMFPFQPVL